MIKRLSIICLLMFSMAGVKAQTYCYHCYKKYDKFEVPEPKDSYLYITFKGDLLYVSEKDGGYAISEFDGKRYENLYKYTGKKVDGAYMYASWSKLNSRPFAGKDYDYNYRNYYLVSFDKNEINYVFSGIIGGYKTDIEPYTLCYKRCPNEDCEQPNVPGMKH